jgi:hypothetical protein
MNSEHGIDPSQSHPPGTLETFHLGLAADGTSCAMVFVDEGHHSIACVASYSDLNGLIASLTQAAAELARRRALPMAEEATADQNDGSDGLELFNVVATNFQEHGRDGSIVGTLVDEGGRVVPIQLRPDVANEMTCNVLKAARAASSC